jgi:endonuclease I
MKLIIEHSRKCAEKVNLEYRHMQADLFNLYPAIGSNFDSNVQVN